MSKRYLILILLLSLNLFASSLASAQIVNIPDANFKAALLAHSPVIDTDGDGEIQQTEATSVQALLISGKNIMDLTGIEAFTSLLNLNCEDNQLSSLDFSFNPLLEFVVCYNNQLTQLNVSANPALYTLSCYHNQLTQLDLTGNPALEQVDCSDNKLTQLDLSGNLILQNLACGYNQLSILDLSTNGALTSLYCRSNQLTLLNISSCSQLNSLDCSENLLTTIDLQSNVMLEQFYCSQNQLANLDVSANTNLINLLCNANYLAQLDVTNNLLLKELTCHANSLMTLDVSANSALTKLSCHTNGLTHLDVTHNGFLQYLQCANNLLSDLDVSMNPDLIFLNCGDNLISQLLLQNNTQLKELMCFNNQITSLDVSGNTALFNLFCFGNQLSNLDLSNNSSLQNVDCNNNLLTQILFGNQTQLSYLACSNNQLTQLNLTQLPALFQLFVNDNLLTKLDLRNGANTSIIDISMVNNPDLYCVSVDDPVYSLNNWISKDIQTSFSADCSCGSLALHVDSLKNIDCTDLGYIQLSTTGIHPPFTYEWLNMSQTTDSILISDSIAFYTVKITDNIGCEAFAKYFLDGPRFFSGFDLGAHLSAFGFRPGNISNVELLAWNDGCQSPISQLTLSYSGPLSFINATAPPASQSGNTLIWDLNNFNQSVGTFLSSLSFQVDNLAQLGDTICFDLLITPVAGDADSTNNHKTFCFNVVNSYDPNDKQVYPQGLCTEHYTQNNRPLTYTIRFQNTGTAPAIDVYLLDSLAPELDLGTLNVLAASHPGLITEVLDSRTLKFNFPDINLADSLSDEAGSKGYVIFEISPIAGLADGTRIENQVGIYFDFNPPVMTNTTHNTLLDSLTSFELNGCNTASGVEAMDQERFMLYPNPTTGKFYLESTTSIPGMQLRITDSQGRLVAEQSCTGQNTEIDLQQQVPGMYLIHLQTAGKEQQVLKIIKE